MTPNVHYRPLPLLSAYRNLGYRAQDVPNAVRLYRREVSLPLSSVLAQEEIRTVSDVFLSQVQKFLINRG